MIQDRTSKRIWDDQSNGATTREQSSSVVTRAIRTVLGLLGPNELPQAPVFAYRDIDDFSYLWGLGESSLMQDLRNEKGGRVTVMVVWNDMPTGSDGVVATENHLSAYDWALAFPLSLQNSDYAPFRIILVDVGSSTSKKLKGAILADMLTAGDSPLFPWVIVQRLAAVDSHPPAPQSLVTDLLFGGGKPNQWFLTSKPPSVEAFGRTPAERMRAIVRPILADGLFSNPENHHAIANWLGPMLLEDAQPKDVQHRNAMKKLLSWLLPSEEKPQVAEQPDVSLSNKRQWIHFEEAKWRDRLAGRIRGSPQALRFILVDDHAFKGGEWARLLCGAMGLKPHDEGSAIEGLTTVGRSGDKKVELCATDDPNWLLRQIFDPNKGISPADQRFDLLRFEDGRAAVLLLDLRMFGPNDASETPFLQNVLAAAKDYQKAMLCPWKQFNSIKLNEIGDWLIAGADPEKPACIHAITLLPRLISSIDLSLPIILFSSTRRRDISNLLEPYGNIVRFFQKPEVNEFRERDKCIERCRTGFEEAMEKAWTLTLAREKCWALSSVPPIQPLQLEQRGCHIEFYVDETELYQQQLMCIGGCFAIFEGKNNAEASRRADGFEDACVRAGIRYFDDPLLPRWHPDPIDIKHKPMIVQKAPATAVTQTTVPPTSASRVVVGDHVYQQVLTAMQDPRSEPPALLGHVRLMVDPNRAGFTRAVVHSPESFDNQHRFGLQALVETFLCELMPVLLDASLVDSAGVSIFVDRRTYYPTDPQRRLEPRSYAKADELQFKWGFERTPGREGKVLAAVRGGRVPDPKDYLGFQSVGGNTVFPIAAQALASRGKSRNLIRALGIALPYKPADWDPVTRSFTWVGEFKPSLYYCRNCNAVAMREEVAFASPRWQCSCHGRDPEVRPFPRSLHYVADDMFRVPCEYAEVLTGKHRTWGLVDVAGGDLQQVLTAGRSLDQNNIPDAVARIFIPCPLPDVERTLSVADLVARRLAPRLKMLTGAEFLRCASLIKEQPNYTGESLGILEYRAGTDSLGNSNITVTVDDERKSFKTEWRVLANLPRAGLNGRRLWVKTIRLNNDKEVVATLRPAIPSSEVSKSTDRRES